MPYKLHIQHDRTRNFIGHPNNRINWARIVNRKTYNAHTNELVEDLDVNPDVPMEVILRPLPDTARMSSLWIVLIGPQLLDSRIASKMAGVSVQQCLGKQVIPIQLYKINNHLYF